VSVTISVSFKIVTGFLSLCNANHKPPRKVPKLINTMNQKPNGEH
jgi:hypothetical protein